MDRKLIDYLPLFIQVYTEIEAIMDAEQIDTEMIWGDSNNVFADQFVKDATENGVARYEKILSITPKATYTLDERKFNILAKLNEQLPYTMESLQIALLSLCGEDGYRLKLEADKYRLVVKLALYNENNLETVRDMLMRMLPANIEYSVQMFNTHTLLSEFTHAQLAAYTHKQLREEIL